MLLHNNAKKLFKMLINDTSLLPPDLLGTGSKFKYSLLHVLHINGAVSHLLCPPFKFSMMVYGPLFPLRTSTVFAFQR